MHHSMELLLIRRAHERCAPTLLTLLLLLSVLALSALGALAVPFADITSASGINVYTVGNPTVDWGAGVAIFDYDNDGDEDLYVVMDNYVANRLYRNNGDGTFTDVAAAAAVDDALWGKGAKCADYDNDGDIDLFLANLFGPNRLYRNNGNGTFTDVAGPAGAYHDFQSYGAGWADYDNDGYLDLYVVTYTGPNLLYHNTGHGTFSEVAAQKGVQLWISNVDEKLGFDCVWLDIENDNDQDLYIINDLWTENVLFRNNGNGTFTDISNLNGSDAGVSMAAMGTAVGDYDNDGYMDIYITNVLGSLVGPAGNVMLHNNGDGTFTDKGRELRVRVNKIGWGTAFIDFDNDGDEDLYVVNGKDKNGGGDVVNVLFRKDGTAFTDITASSGAANAGASYGLAYGDLNNDGFIDMFVHNRNDPSALYGNTANNNNWIKIKTVGTSSNRDGIGARITLTAGGKTQIRDVRGDESYCSHNSLTRHFGLGTVTSVDRIEIRWPSGTVDVHTNIGVNKTVKVTEGGSLEVAPVFITRFDASAVDEGVQLIWEIFRDEPIAGFRVYRSQGLREERIGGLIPPEEHGYLDSAVVPGAEYDYAVVVEMPDGSVIRSRPVHVAVPTPVLALDPNFPNPFNPTTSIRYVLPEASQATLQVFDVEGRHVVTLANGHHAAGPHTVTWKGRDTAGVTVATGVYFYRLQAGKKTLTRKMILLK